MRKIAGKPFQKIAAFLLVISVCVGLHSASALAAFSVTQYPVPTSGGEANAIVHGSDGNFWFTEATGDKIGKITPTGTITEYSVSPGSKPAQLAAGPDDNIWFTEADGIAIGKITMAGVVTEYPLVSGNEPAWIAAGPDGNMWATLRPNAVAKIAMNGTITEYPTPSFNSRPSRITAGADGNLWVTEIGRFGGDPDGILKVTPSGTVTEYPLPAGSTPTNITAGPDGNVWFTESSVQKIGKITPVGVLTEYDLPVGLVGSPSGMTVDSDNKLWFSISGSDEVITITTSGVMTEYPVVINSMYEPFPTEFIMMPGHKIWYVHPSFNVVAVMGDWGVVEPPDPAPAPAPDPSTGTYAAQDAIVARLVTTPVRSRAATAQPVTPAETSPNDQASPLMSDTLDTPATNPSPALAQTTATVTQSSKLSGWIFWLIGVVVVAVSLWRLSAVKKS